MPKWLISSEGGHTGKSHFFLWAQINQRVVFMSSMPPRQQCKWGFQASSLRGLIPSHLSTSIFDTFTDRAPRCKTNVRLRRKP